MLGRTLRLVAIGLIIGSVVGLWASRFLASLLFGLPPRDLVTLFDAAYVLLAVAVLASGVPAQRASRIDPAQVLGEG
jgi:ABC-type antimicrobial peptide transport system permease subunit